MSAVPAILDASSNKTTWDSIIEPFFSSGGILFSRTSCKDSKTFLAPSLDILLVSNAAYESSKERFAITPSNNVSTSLPISKLILCSICWFGSIFPFIAVVTDVYTFSESLEFMYVWSSLLSVTIESPAAASFTDAERESTIPEFSASATLNNCIIIGFCVSLALSNASLICINLAGDKLYLSLPSTLFSSLNWIPSVLSSLATSLSVVLGLIADTGRSLPVIYWFKFSITPLNHSITSLTFAKKLFVGVVSYSFLKCLDNAFVTISIFISVSLKFLVLLL